VHRCNAATQTTGRPSDPVVDSKKRCRLWPYANEAANERMPVMWVLLLLPFVGLLWVPFYNFQEPALFGFPFFYWYQLAWVPICSFLIWIVYRSQKPDDETP
jgi:Protein of unknown function (DUF3311)